MLHSSLTTFGESSSSGLGALGVDFHAFVIQLVTFGLAYLVLRRYAFGPILKILRERRETIDSGVKLGEDMKAAKAKLEAEVDDLLHKARQQADGIITGAQDSGRQAIREAEDKARQKAAGILKEADSRIEQDTSRARQALENELVSLVAETTEVILGEKIDAKKDAGLIERALKERQAA